MPMPLPLPLLPCQGKIDRKEKKGFALTHPEVCRSLRRAGTWRSCPHSSSDCTTSADVVVEVLVADRDPHLGKDDVVGVDDEVDVVDGREQACGLATDLQERWNPESLESAPLR
jgi:hypothetical protein